MSRRRSSKQDSLELLLDTICNTFGGVLFIAIMVVLLIQQTGHGPADATPASTSISPADMQATTTRMETAQLELTRLRQNRDSQDLVVQNFAPDSIRQLLITRSERKSQQESLQMEVDQLLAENAVLAARVEDLDRENNSVRQNLEKSRVRLQTAQSKLRDDRQSRVETVRLPVVRESHKQEIGLVMRYGRLYVWHRYDEHLSRLGLNTDDFVVVGEESDGLVTRPKPTAGVPLDSSVASQGAVRQVLRRFDRETCYLVVVARPDSYSVFRHLRDRALELGFEYRLMPLDSEDAVSDRGGRGGRVQ